MLFFKSLLDNLFSFRTLSWFAQSVSGDGSLDIFNFHSVSGWEQVVVVDNLDKWLDLGSLGNFLSTVSFVDLQWVSVNTSNYSVWEWVGFGTFVVWFDDNDFSTSKTSTDNNC